LTLTPGQLGTLQNLARKKTGAMVGWVDIAEARGLTELGLAARNRSGWEITPEGEAVLERQSASAVEGAPATLPFRPRDQDAGV
jgi:hypothetical protein